jgi:hypothetical protein
MEGCKCKPAKSYAERIIEYREFVSLVKRMREAQVKRFEFYVDDGWWADRAIELEKEVDEYLKKMEF